MLFPPSLLYTNNYQDINYSEYLQIETFNVNTVLLNAIPTQLILLIPSDITESILTTPSSANYISTDSYYEDNLSAPREDEYYFGEYVEQDVKNFYRVTDNDLSTGVTKTLYEYTLTTSYIYLHYEINNLTHKIYIPIPLKEEEYNYYIDNILSVATFKISLSHSKDITTQTRFDSFNNVSITDVSDYNYSTNINALNRIIIEGLPATNITCELYLNSIKVSETNSANAIEHYPRVDFTTTQYSLNKLAYILYPISDYRPLDFNILLEACTVKLSADFKDYYLPLSNLELDSTNYPSPVNVIYNYYDNAIVVLALLHNYTKLNDRTTSKFRKYLETLITKLTTSINLYTGYCNKTISNNLTPIIVNDITTTVIVSLILEKYISYSYDSLLEYLLYVVNTQLETLVTNEELLDSLVPTLIDYSVLLAEPNLIDVENTINTYYHLVLWLKARNQDSTIINLKLENLINTVDVSSISIEGILKINYILSLNLGLNVLSSISTSWSYTNHLTVNSFSLWGDITPSMYYTAWVNIISNQIPIWVESSYRNKYKEVKSLSALIHQKSLQSIPLNEPWFDIDKLNPSIGLIGLFLKSVNNTLLPLLFEYICHSTSLYLEDAYGVGLDRWGLFLNIKREENEDDTQYKLRLQSILKIDFLNQSTVLDFVNALKLNLNTTLLSSLPTTILYNGQSYQYTDIEELYSIAKEIEETEGRLGVYITDGEFYDFTKELGCIKIDSYENSVINEIFLKLNTLYDVPVILKTRFSVEVLNNSNIIY